MLSHIILLSVKQLPEEKAGLEGLPLGDAYDYPEDYKERMESACQKTLVFIKDSTASAVQDDTYDSSSDASYYAQQHIVPDSNEVTTTSTEHLQLVRALSQCPALNLGFHCHPFYPEGDQNWCCCPFGKKMRRWRMEFGIHVERECSGKASEKRVEPHALLHHIKDKASTGRADVDSVQGKHQILSRYLECLYENYVIRGYKHLAFYDKLSKEYNVVQKALKRENKRYSIDPVNETGANHFVSTLTHCSAPSA